MSYQEPTDKFIHDLEQIVRVRSEISLALDKIAQTIDKAEIDGNTASG